MVDDWFKAFINDVEVAAGDDWWVMHKITIDSSPKLNLDPWKEFTFKVTAKNIGGEASIAYLLKERNCGKYYH